MDVGQALQPGEAPLCSSEHLSRCASAPPIFTRPRRSTISLSITISPTHCLQGDQRSNMRRNQGTGVHREICRPKLHFLTTNQITSCWHGGKMAINNLMRVLCVRHPLLWPFSDEVRKNIVIHQQVPVHRASPTMPSSNEAAAECDSKT